MRFCIPIVLPAHAHGTGSNRAGADGKVHPQGRVKHEEGVTAHSDRVPWNQRFAIDKIGVLRASLHLSLIHI